MNFVEYDFGNWESNGYWLPAICSFVTDLEPGDLASPSLDFRFSQFYLPAIDLHICSGVSFDGVLSFSPSSGVNLNLQDCALHNGQIDLGQPEGYPYYPVDQVFGSGAVTWNNTLFENVDINLDPTYNEFGWDDQGLNVNLSFQANNNLFRGGNWLHLEPIPLTNSCWVFENNLFDQVNFIQDTAQPLDYAYNAYWPLPPHELASDGVMQQAMLQARTLHWYVPNASSLQMTTTLDGFSDGQNEQYLTAAPPYQSGTFGNYYVPNNTPLYGNGSTNAAALGLYHYTTQPNQFKEGNEAPGHMVNIGLHYVAASALGAPLDTDNDRIPDYVEDANGDGIVEANETDWLKPSTDGVNPDASNAVYLNIDLSGDGLVGRIKAALGMNPLDPSNPFTLRQVISGDEPDVVSFEVPINYNAMVNIGHLNLSMDGIGVRFEASSSATDGNTLLTWNTTYQTPGPHCLQPRFTINYAGDDSAIVIGRGNITPFNSANAMRFFAGDSLFNTNIAYLEAQLPTQYSGQNVNYTIQLNDPSAAPPTPLRTITGSTSSGTIQESWNLVEDDGVTAFTGNTFTATFNAVFPDGTSGKNTKTLNKIVATEKIGDHDGFDFVYMYMPTNDALYLDYGNYGGVPGYIWQAMLNPVDTLLSPLTDSGGSPNYYTSSFDICDDENFPGQPGDPGYCDGLYIITNSIGGLFASMSDGGTRNFYCKAHGSETSMASSAGTTPSCAIFSSDVEAKLGNDWDPRIMNGGLSETNPYRFVFLDGCATASVYWQAAFGIMSLWEGTNSPFGPQALVGWATNNESWITGAYNGTNFDYYYSIASASAFAQNLADDFYFNWLNNVPLASCIYTASNPQDGSAPFPASQWPHTNLIKGTDSLGPYTFSVPNLKTSPIYVIGHSGLTRNGVDTNQDNQYHDPEDHP